MLSYDGIIGKDFKLAGLSRVRAKELVAAWDVPQDFPQWQKPRTSHLSTISV